MLLPFYRILWGQQFLHFPFPISCSFLSLSCEVPIRSGHVIYPSRRGLTFFFALRSEPAPTFPETSEKRYHRFTARLCLPPVVPWINRCRPIPVLTLHPTPPVVPSDPSFPCNNLPVIRVGPTTLSATDGPLLVCPQLSPFNTFTPPSLLHTSSRHNAFYAETNRKAPQQRSWG